MQVNTKLLFYLTGKAIFNWFSEPQNDFPCEPNEHSRRQKFHRQHLPIFRVTLSSISQTRKGFVVTKHRSLPLFVPNFVQRLRCFFCCFFVKLKIFLHSSRFFSVLLIVQCCGTRKREVSCYIRFLLEILTKKIQPFLSELVKKPIISLTLKLSFSNIY